MRSCSKCGYQNPDEVKACLKCAAALGSSCPTCKTVVPTGSKFCSQCGTRLPESLSEPAVLPPQAEVRQSLRAMMPTSLVEKINATATEIVGERREITVLFSDIANFTATAHMLDSEDIYLLTDETMRLLAEVVYKYEGIIDKFMGDGLLALFGMPVAHENDPERAVRSALEMHSALQPLRQQIMQRYGLEFQTRIGIHTGLVIAGQVGSDLHMEYTVIGDTVNLAYRLQSAAEPGTVAVSFATYQRSRPFFRYMPLPRFRAKGKPDPIRAFRPLSLRTKPGQVRGLPGLQVPMIGRRDALNQLQNTWADVRRHACSRIALITGEAGLGKSRLIAEFRQSVAHSEPSFYQGSCMTYARSQPLWLLANVLRDILHLSETDPAEAQRDTWLAYLDQLALTSSDIFPYLSNVLGLAQADPRIESRLRHLDNTALQKLTHAALRQVFLAEARLGPTILVFEDLHWVDPASRDFLEHLIQTVDEVPLMIILVSRDAERDTVLQPLVAATQKRRDPLVDIQLRPLSAAEGQLLVGRFIKQTTQEAEALKRRIVERAEGIPFYAEEIVRMLIEQGGLEGEDGTWQVTSKAVELVQAVPGTLNGLVLARFDPLPEDLRRTLQKAAVLGSSFPVNLLLNLNGAQPDKLAAQLGALETRQFLITSPFGDGEGYSFRHALIQDVVYHTLLRRDRQKLHEQVAQVIERGTYWLPDEQTEAIAYHYAESTTPSKAVPYLISAGENAARRCAYETAIQHYRRALALMPDQPNRHGDQFLRAQVGLAQALKFVGKYTEAAQILEEAFQHLLRQSLVVDSNSLLPILVRGLSELADIRVREGASEEAVDHLEAGLEALGEEGAQAQPQLWRSLIDRLAWVRFRQGKLEQAFSLASSATLGLDAEKRDDPVTLASLYNTLGGVFWQWGNLPEATDYVEHSLMLYQSLGYAWGMAIAYTNLGVLHYVQGMWPQAAEYFEQAYTLRRENGYLPEQALNLNNLGLLRMAMGDHSQAQQDLEASLAIGRRLGDDFSIALAEIGLGHLALVQGHFEQAAAHIEVTLDRSDIVGEDQAIQARWLWALIQAERGNLQAGLESGEQALQMAREASLTEVEADCRRVLGVLHARAGDDREAESLLREAVDLCLQVNAPYGEGQALLELGSLYQQLARPGDQTQGEWQAKATTALTSAIERFESLGAAYDLQRAHALLSRCEGDVLADIPLNETRVSGTEIAPSHSRQGIPEGEWHTAAIVWLDLSPPPDADEEAVFETLSLIIPDLTAIAVEHQGRVIRRQDGLTVVYGAPTAYEDDTERAVKTAWGLVRHLGKAAHQNEVPLTCQVAVSQGEIVAGHIGPSFHTSFTIKGEPVQSAQQAAESASPGKVWVTEAVRAATERFFIYQPAPSPSATEPAAPVLFELVGLREQAGPTRGVPGLKAKLIGRDTPLQAMADMAKNLSQDIGGLIWIEGEPGIGKSRLMREFADLTASSAPLVWAGRCTPQRSSHVFSLFSHLFTQALDLQPTDTPDQIRDRIYQATQTWPRDAQVTRPYLEVLLGVQPSGLDGERLSKLEPEQLRQQVFVALRRLLKSLADEQPLVLLLDDLHWIDPISAELLQFLLSLVTSTPILFVCAQRRQGADSPNDRLVRAQSLIPTQTLSLMLDRLSTKECKTLLNELLPGAELPARLLDIILERSEGNPYFIEEYIRVLIEQGHLQHHEGGWAVDPNRDLEDVPLPSSLETLIRSRVDALPTDLKQLVQYASVIGTPFEASLLAAVAEISDIKGALARLESRLLVHRGSEAGRWEFSHLLFETVVYNSILKARRKTIHQRVASALEARWAGAETEHAQELAYHYTLAGESGKALTYLVLAGERAAAQYANEEAKSYFEQAVQQLGTHVEVVDGIHWRLSTGLGDVYRAIGQYTESIAALEEGLAHATIDGNSSVQRASLYRRLGDTTLKQGELDATHEHFAQALTILGELTEPDAQAEVARVLHGLAWIHFVKGHFDQAREACEASMQYARSVSALSELASAENLLGGIFYRQSDWKPALHHTMRAMILREQMGYTWGVAATLGNLGVLAVSAGHWSKARSFFERSLALRHDMGDVEGMAIAHNNLGMLARDQGELELAEFHFKESLAVATPFKIAFHVANATINLAQVFLRKDEIERAQEAIADSMDQAQAIGAEDMLAEIYWIQAEIHLATLAWDESRAYAEQSAARAAETGNRSLETAAWRVISEVELQRGNLSAAREALSKAQQTMSHGADELETGRVAAVAGQIHLREGQSAQAEEDFRVAQEIFMRLGASPDLKRVESALV